jgi:hypothetical protein
VVKTGAPDAFDAEVRTVSWGVTGRKVGDDLAYQGVRVESLACFFYEEGSS